jgi:hypothetical protein
MNYKQNLGFYYKYQSKPFAIHQFLSEFQVRLVPNPTNNKMFKFLVLGLLLIANNVQVAFCGSPMYMPPVSGPPVSSVMIPSIPSDVIPSIPSVKIPSIPSVKISTNPSVMTTMNPQSIEMEPAEDDEEYLEDEEAEMEVETTQKPTKKHKNPNGNNKNNKKGSSLTLGQPRQFE